MLAATLATLATRLPGLSLASTANFTSGYLDVHSAVGDMHTFFAYADHPDPTLPLIVWMNGGPGASSLMGFFTELGPFLLNAQSAPTADGERGWQPFANPYSFCHLGSLLVWEQPAGVGFSRCVDGCPKAWNDTSSAAANLAILKAFYFATPSAKARSLIITGESYGGVYVPLLAQLVLHDTHMRDVDRVRLRGVAIGDGCIGFGVGGGCGTDALDVFISVLERAAPGVDRKVLAGARTDCSVAELTTGRLPGQLSPKCAAALQSVFVEIGEYNEYHWASPCGPDGQGNWGDGSAFACATGILPKYLALPQTQQALGVIRSGEPPLTWTEWDGDAPLYNITAADVQPVYRELLRSNISMLIYSGLADTGVPAVGAERWLPRVAGSKLKAARRKWGKPPSGGFAGHVTDYASGLTFATVAGAGHLVPGDRPIAALTMMRAWIHGEPLPAYQGKACKRLWLGRGYGDFC